MKDAIAEWTEQQGWERTDRPALGIENELPPSADDHPRDPHEASAALQRDCGFSTWRMRMVLEELYFQACGLVGTADVVALHGLAAEYLTGIRLLRGLDGALLTGKLEWRDAPAARRRR